jgi:hypothetical protein
VTTLEVRLHCIIGQGKYLHTIPKARLDHPCRATPPCLRDATDSPGATHAKILVVNSADLSKE